MDDAQYKQLLELMLEYVHSKLSQDMRRKEKYGDNLAEEDFIMVIQAIQAALFILKEVASQIIENFNKCE